MHKRFYKWGKQAYSFIAVIEIATFNEKFRTTRPP